MNHVLNFVKNQKRKSFVGITLIVVSFTLLSCSHSAEQRSDSVEMYSDFQFRLGSENLLEIRTESTDKQDTLSLSEITENLHSIGPINGIIISQSREVLAEEYFNSMNAGRYHNIKSASKSILSILTGIAIEKGYFSGVDQKIADFFPDFFEQNSDSLKASITIEHLLTMRSGLASTSRANYGRWVTSNNWIQYALERPMQGKPGVDRIYSTGNTHLLSVAIERASGMSALQFANKYLFGPMDIRVGGWDQDPQGYYLGGNNMALLPRDIVKIGRLMMDLGEYNGERLVSAKWIKQSVEPLTGRMNNLNYGYLWFRRMSGGYDMIYAFGNGGQYLMMIPELDAVITVTTRNNNRESTRGYRRELFSVIDQDIMPRLAQRYDADNVVIGNLVK